MARRMSVTAIEEVSDPEISRSEVDESIGSTGMIASASVTRRRLLISRLQKGRDDRLLNFEIRRLCPTQAQLEAKMRNSKLLALVVV